MDIKRFLSERDALVDVRAVLLHRADDVVLHRSLLRIEPFWTRQCVSDTQTPAGWRAFRPGGAG